MCLQASGEALDNALVELQGGDPLASIESFSAVLARVEDIADWLVLSARDEGASWGDIASALGVSRQAAHQRFSSLMCSSPVEGQASGAVKWREPKLPT